MSLDFLNYLPSFFQIIWTGLLSAMFLQMIFALANIYDRNKQTIKLIRLTDVKISKNYS
jgi:hypothetical protein